jgi:hypothetical protein
MTLETRYLADVADVLGFRFECKSCKTAVAWALTPRRQLPFRCPSCSQDILGATSTVRSGMSDVMQGLETLLRALPEEGCPVRIRLEFERPKAE